MKIVIDLNEFELCIGALKDSVRKFDTPIQSTITDLERLHLEGTVYEEDAFQQIVEDAHELLEF